MMCSINLLHLPETQPSILRPLSPQEDSDQLALRLFVDEQSRLLKDFSEQLELCVSTLKQDVAAIVRRKRERSGIWS